MAYFKIGDIDFSTCVNELKVNKYANYNSETNASGDTVVDLINQKHEIEVGIIPLNSAQMISLLSAIDAFNVTISYRNPLTGELAEGVNVIIPESNVEYYTIRADKVQFKAFSLTFIEL